MDKSDFHLPLHQLLLKPSHASVLRFIPRHLREDLVTAAAQDHNQHVADILNGKGMTTQSED